jgi:hypothetical protein
MSLLKIIKKYRKRFMVIGVIAVIIALLWSMLIPIIGIYKVKMIFMDMFKKKNTDSSIEMGVDIASEDLEGLIDEMQEDIFKINNYPIYLEDIKKALEREKETYSQQKFKHNIQKIKLKKETNNFSLSKKEVVEGEVDLKEIEYDYRVPWQIISATDFYLMQDKMDYTLKSLLPTYTYEYFKEIKFKFFEQPNSFINKDKANHKININRDSTVPYDDLNYKFYAIGSKEPVGANRYDSIEDEKTIIERKHYKKTQKGWKSTGTSKKVKRYITKVEPSLKIKEIITPLKKINYKYTRHQVFDQLIAEDKNIDRDYDDSGNATKKTITKIKKYKSYDKIEIEEVLEEDNSIVFAQFLDNVGIGEENADDFRETVSLYPGGYYIAAGMRENYIDQYLDDHLKIVSELKNPVFGFIGDIVIEPSELLLPIPRFSQIDSRWSKIRYGDSTIGRGGCGPTAASMVITGLTKDIVTPVDAARISVENGCKDPKGTTWRFFRIIANEYNIRSNQYSTKDYQRVLDELKEGNPAIASMGPGHFTSKGHFIVLAGIDENGHVIVNDPYDPFNIKNRPWDFRIILNEAKQFWTFKNP